MSDLRTASSQLLPSGDWLIGGGEMGKYIRPKDWSPTPLGPIESWPPNLRTVVSLAMADIFWQKQKGTRGSLFLYPVRG